MLAALGLGQFLKYQLNHGLAFDSQDARDLLGSAARAGLLPVRAARRAAGDAAAGDADQAAVGPLVRRGHRRGVRAEAGSRQRRAAAVLATSSG